MSKALRTVRNVLTTLTQFIIFAKLNRQQRTLIYKFAVTKCLIKIRKEKCKVYYFLRPFLH